ncbi:MAG: DUF1016 N-terminal domain-containing protein [Candidatus Loosdrechtia sp.]|uniref:DUF1016 N-terminal domain-containing protein n=1 Tax=Candidatus Loosdrechtia sp. TaxID=3101272 RepID=UPI003A78B251|nr:MAG: DUF1016 N-terminal domain-containing protein [Candidatus Jettenia sp. AMX2]
MRFNLIIDKEYKDWLTEIKLKVRHAQLKAAVKVNTELLVLYWELGADIVAKQEHAKWGEGLINRLSKDLMSEFPDMKGFSRSNLMYIKKWYLFYRKSSAIVQQPVGQFTKQLVSQFPVRKISQQPVGQIGQQIIAQITQISWGYNILLLEKIKDAQIRICYMQKIIEHG